ncbi:MAG: DUF4405 domain-containing protein [SAR86 cluster bacterium]|jgi:hypothetical protein|nr:DUF4405 domain-containing protein [SAR86 cluster bacterium]|tara:strand:- start:1624 stop:1959 length:336 start_codon:yes stop_codon:yes gene_type:complete
MLRKITAITLAVSFVAMSTSGLMMFVIEKPSFTIQMHPVHKLFGLILILAVIFHLFFNYSSLLGYLSNKLNIIYGLFLVALLIVLYGVVLNNKVPDNLAQQMDNAAEEAEK